MPIRSIISPVRSCSSAFSAKKSITFCPSSTSFARSSSVSSFMNGNDHRAHQVADLQRPLAADQHRRALVLAGRQRAGHHVDAVHAAHAVAVLDLEPVRLAERHRRHRRPPAFSSLDLLQPDRLGRAARDDVVDELVHPVLREPPAARAPRRCGCCRARCRSPPCQRARSSSCSRSGSPLNLNLNLYGSEGPVDVVEEAVDHGAVRGGLVVARLLAARRADARHRRAHRRTRAAEVEAELVDRVERRLHVRAGHALEHDVARLPVERDQPRAVAAPRCRHILRRTSVL